MSDLLRLSGSLSVAAASGSPSGHASQSVPIDEQLPVDHARANLHYDLVDDTPQVVSLDGLSVSFLLVKASDKIKVRITTADGAQQVVPGTFMLLLCDDVPITALDVLRQPAVETLVDITVGIKPAA